LSESHHEPYWKHHLHYRRRIGYRGRDEIDRITSALSATHPDFTYQLIAEPEELGNVGRV
jgi:hypothetical protein